MTDSNTVPALVKSIRLLERVAVDPGLSAAALARELGLAPATGFRIIQTLCVHGWLRHDGDGGLHLASGLLPILRALDDDSALIDLVRPQLASLVAATGLSAKCSIREDSDQVIVAHHNANKPFTVTGTTGTRFPVLNGSSGAALLLDASDLDAVLATMSDDEPQDSPRLLLERQAAIRAQGWCGKIGVHPQGIDGISAPVRDRSGRVRSAITLLGLRGDMTPDTLPGLGKALRECAAACQLALTHHQEQAP